MRSPEDPAESSRPLFPQERAWVESLLERSLVEEPGTWFVRLVIGGYILLIAAVVVTNVGYYHALGEDGIVLFLIAWTAMVLGKSWLDGLFGSGSATTIYGESKSIEALTLTGSCAFDEGRPCFQGKPCHVPPGWEDVFPVGNAQLEVVHGVGRRHWVVVGIPGRTLRDDLGRGLEEYLPARPRTLRIMALLVLLTLVPLELTGSVYGSDSWNNLWGPGAQPVVVESAQDLDPAWLDPGREVEVHGLIPFAGDAWPPDGNTSLAPFRMMPKRSEWIAYDQVMKRIACRLEDRARVLKGDLDTIANVSFPCLDGNRSWETLQLNLLDYPLVKDPARLGITVEHVAYYREGRRRMAQHFLERGMSGFRNEEVRILDSLVKDAVAALNDKPRLIWVRGADDDEEITRAEQVHVEWDDNLAAIESKIQISFPDMEPVEAVVLEKHAKGWILRRSYRHRVVVALVTGWLAVVALGVPWLLVAAWRQARRNRSYLKAVSTPQSDS